MSSDSARNPDEAIDSPVEGSAEDQLDSPSAQQQFNLAYEAAAAWLTVNLRIGGRDPVELAELITRLSRAVEQVRLKDYIEADVHRLLANLHFALQDGLNSNTEKTNAQRTAFSYAYAAAVETTTFVWNGSSEALETLPFALDALARVCSHCQLGLRREEHGAAIEIFLKAGPLLEPQSGIAQASAAFAINVSFLGLSHVGDEAFGPPSGRLMNTVLGTADWYSKRAIDLLYLSRAKMLEDGFADQDVESSISLITQANANITRLLTFAADTHLAALRALLSSCAWVSHLRDRLRTKGLDGGTAMQRTFESTASVLASFIVHHVDAIDADALAWLDALRQLPKDFWSQDTLTLATEVDGVEKGTSSLSDLERLLNYVEFASILKALHELMQAGAEQARPQESSPERDDDSIAVPLGATLTALIAAPSAVSATRDPMLKKVLTALFGAEESDAAEAHELAETLVAMLRDPPDHMRHFALFKTYGEIEGADYQDPHLLLDAIEQFLDRDLLPALRSASEGGDLEMTETVCAVVSALLARCAKDTDFLEAGPARRLVTLALGLEVHPPLSERANVVHMVNGALWMLGRTDLSASRLLLRRSTAFLETYGARPTPENVVFGRYIVETMRFIAGSRFRLAEVFQLADDLDSGVALADANMRADQLLDDLSLWITSSDVEAETQSLASMLLAELSMASDTNSHSQEETLSAEGREYMIEHRPSSFLAYVIARNDALEDESNRLAARELMQRSLQTGKPSFSGELWASLLDSGISDRLHLPPSSRLQIARRYWTTTPAGTPASATGVLKVCNAISDLLDSSTWAAETHELLEEVAGACVPVAAGILPNPDLLRFLIGRLGDAVNQVVTAHEYSSRAAVAMASYTLAVWSDNKDMCALGAYFVAEFWRLKRIHAVADWWYGLYDYWLARGALADAQHEGFRRIVESDRMSPLTAPSDD